MPTNKNNHKPLNVIICNYDTQPGYAGVDNPLYHLLNSHLMLGDAKETVGNLVRQEAMK